jgi:hypothetical protein
MGLVRWVPSDYTKVYTPLHSPIDVLVDGFPGRHSELDCPPRNSCKARRVAAPAKHFPVVSSPSPMKRRLAYLGPEEGLELAP